MLLLGKNSADTLEHVLSYLNLFDLAQCGFTCKDLASVVFHDGGASSSSSNDIVWEGAENGLTGANKRLQSIASAKEHCHLFVLASKYAKFCDESETMPDEGEMGKDVPLKLMNIRGIDKESVVDAGGDEEQDIDLSQFQFQTMTDEEQRESAKKSKAKWEEIQKEEAPKKEHDHEIFVRITRNETNELVGHGFVKAAQTMAWIAPMDVQKLELELGPNLRVRNSEEYRTLLQNSTFKDGRMDYPGVKEYVMKFRYTIVAICKKDLNVKLIRCTGTVDEETTSSTSGISSRHSTIPIQNVLAFLSEFPSFPKWEPQSFQLTQGPFGRYMMNCDVGICFRYWKEEKSCDSYPLLVLTFIKDPTVTRQILMSSFQQRHPEVQFLE